MEWFHKRMREVKNGLSAKGWKGGGGGFLVDQVRQNLGTILERVV